MTSSFEKLLSSDLLRSLVIKVANQTVISQFPNLVALENTDNSINWIEAVRVASILACSDHKTAQEYALQLASGCLLSTGADQQARFGASTVLDRLANTLTVDLAKERGYLPNFENSDLSIAAKIQSTRLNLEYSLQQHDGTELRVNEFQKNLFASLSDSRWVSATASTSVGKSYAMGAWIANELYSKATSVTVLVVPTRALIHENEIRLRKILIQDKALDVEVRSIPTPSNSDRAHEVYVFTQERLHLWLSNSLNKQVIDHLIVDEAHKVGDGARGVLLQQALELVESKSPETQVVFLSPSTSNPEILLQDAPDGAKCAVASSNTVTVLQNLLWATQVDLQPKQWKLALVKGTTNEHLGTFSLPADPSPESKRLTFVAYALGDRLGSNIIYANGASEAEKYCQQLYDLVGEGAEDEFAQERKDIAELAKSSVHHDYLLVKLIERGIAYHYGNMPLMLRSEIESLFELGGIKYLVCTSTLVEGVNTACKSIFMRGPKKGPGRRMSESDFWNLAGRAGRWGREFQGNIVCVDAAKEKIWGPKLAPTERAHYKIRRQAVEVVSESNQLIKYIESGAPRDEASSYPALESTVAYLGATLSMGKPLSSLAWTSSVDTSVLDRITNNIMPIINQGLLSKETIASNPGISIFAMQSLFRHFQESEHTPEELSPVLPSSEDAAKQYGEIFRRISQEMNPDFGKGRFPYAMGILTVNWMKGFPVSRIIKKRLDNLSQKGTEFDTQKQIRDTLSLIEKFPRFLVPRYISCYSSVLKDYLVSQGKNEQAENVIDVAVRLELGVSNETQISLTALGLSRTTAIAISELIAADNLSENEVLTWLSKRSWSTATLPALVKKEIDRCLSIYSNRLKS